MHSCRWVLLRENCVEAEILKSTSEMVAIPNLSEVKSGFS
jgi:hypothetical protein